ncbi:MAG: hypothetical protein HS126_40070 [Anaerolineales bacterium]|nr:hypothetical protein [Anaerolineales bacterium]
MGTLKVPYRWVTGVAVTPDGQQGVSSSVDQTLRVWDLERKVELRMLRGHTDVVNDVAVTPDGLYAVSAAGSYAYRVGRSNDGTLKCGIWSMVLSLYTLGGHTSGVRAVAVTPDGRLAVSGS